MYMTVEQKPRKVSNVANNLVGSLIISYVLFNMLNLYIWSNHFNVIDVAIKPFILAPIPFICVALLTHYLKTSTLKAKILQFKSNMSQKWQAHIGLVYAVISLALTYKIFILFHLYVLNGHFNPVDLIIKPFLALPIAAFITMLLVKGTKYTQVRKKYVTELNNSNQDRNENKRIAVKNLVENKATDRLIMGNFALHTPYVFNIDINIEARIGKDSFVSKVDVLEPFP
ncbi:hypothetical protein [Evansella cellulosilytica]|uniref:Uncharacterized protein n=1 Tax=Evansella cellulosilytica (strain ATCC 21833 / DSM 2522 / FERM P-1141 / JCM 9156 / N-4) TaxID=649639 RepID=E6TU69_EVAC2|nr:hypothetical protein [Evansella cellulosilytica]ADU28529.1 hypothetical protein Bcell_0242 [Evansella cellulosilytica DSM 2522]